MQRTQEKKRQGEEQKRYQATLEDKEKDDQEFRKRSDSERRRRLQVMFSISQFKDFTINIDMCCNLVKRSVLICFLKLLKYMSFKTVVTLI